MWRHCLKLAYALLISIGDVLMKPLAWFNDVILLKLLVLRISAVLMHLRQSALKISVNIFMPTKTVYSAKLSIRMIICN